MAGFTTAYSRTTLDSAIVNGDHVLWSDDGVAEATELAGTAITTWLASTNADPCIRANDGAYETATASGGVTISHYSVWDSTETTQKTDWTSLDNSRIVANGEKLSIADGAIKVTLT